MVSYILKPVAFYILGLYCVWKGLVPPMSITEHRRHSRQTELIKHANKQTTIRPVPYHVDCTCVQIYDFQKHKYCVYVFNENVDDS